MIEFIDDLDRYTGTRRPIHIPPTEEEWIAANTGPCMECGEIDELSWALCWTCIKRKNGMA